MCSSAAGTIIGIIILFIIILLIIAIAYWQYKKTVIRQEEHIYDYISPPQLPPPRLTTHDNPAYERVVLNDCVAYSSRRCSD